MEFSMHGKEKQYHQILAEYFSAQPLFLDDKKEKPNKRKCIEQSFQQTKGEMWEDLSGTLCDLSFIEAKSANGMTYDLINDYSSALRVLPEAKEEAKKGDEQQRRDMLTSSLL
jgi:hypothetical protein